MNTTEPVYYRYRHSAEEKWHYGATQQSWWECQGLVPEDTLKVQREQALSKLSGAIVSVDLWEKQHEQYRDNSSLRMYREALVKAITVVDMCLEILCMNDLAAVKVALPKKLDTVLPIKE